MLVRVVDRTGRTVASEGPFRTTAIPESAAGSAQQRQSAFFTLDGADGDMPVRLYTVPYEANGVVYGFIAVGQSLRTMQRLSAADLDQRLNLDLPDDEVGRLARTFDTMLARLDDAFHRQRQFTA